jgi:hypothetical protein
MFVCSGNQTRLYSPSGTVLWTVGGAGRITRKNVDEVWVDNSTTVAIFDLQGLVRSFPAESSFVWAALPGDAYARGEGSVVRAYNEFGSILWSFSLDAPCKFLSRDSRYLLAVTDSTVYWLDHQGSLLRQTAATPAPHQAYLDGLGGAHFRTASTYDRHTRHFGIVAIEPDPQLMLASGPQSDLYTVKYDDGYVVRRYRAGVDHYQATLTRGIPVQHSHYALMHSGDGYWRLGPGVTLSTAHAPVSIMLDYLAPPESPSQMAFIIESRGSASAIRQTVEAFDVQAGAWVVIEGATQLPSGGSADRYKVLGIDDPENFIDPTTRRVRVRIEYRAVGPVLSFPWQASIDRTMLRYIKEESK